jgi:hypothetical protein
MFTFKYYAYCEIVVEILRLPKTVSVTRFFCGDGEKFLVANFSSNPLDEHKLAVHFFHTGL